MSFIFSYLVIFLHTLLNSSRIQPCFLWGKLTLWGNGLKISRFVNQSNINKPEFDLAQIRLKYFRTYFANLRLLRFKLTDQSYLGMRLKSCYRFQPYSIYMLYILSFTTLYEWLFFSQLPFYKGRELFYLLFCEDNIWGRAPMVSLFSRKFLRHIKL